MYTVVRHTKSVGVSILLVCLFGPFGLFYSSVIGGLLLAVLPTVLLYYSIAEKIEIFLLSGLLVTAYFSKFLIFILSYYGICIIWAIIATNIYNRKLIAGSVLGNIHNAKEEDKEIIAQNLKAHEKISKKNLKETIVCLAAIVGLIFYYAFFSDNPFINKKERTSSEWIVVSEANVYKFPNAKSSIIEQTDEEQEVAIFGKTKYFTEISFNNDEGKYINGYVLNSYVIKNPDYNVSE